MFLTLKILRARPTFRSSVLATALQTYLTIIKLLLSQKLLPLLFQSKDKVNGSKMLEELQIILQRQRNIFPITDQIFQS